MSEQREETCREIARRVSDTFGGVKVVVHILPASARFSVYDLPAPSKSGLHRRIVTRVPLGMIDAVTSGKESLGQLSKDIVDSTRHRLKEDQP